MKELRRDPRICDTWPQDQTEKGVTVVVCLGFFIPRFTDFPFIVFSRLDINSIFVLK